MHQHRARGRQRRPHRRLEPGRIVAGPGGAVAAGQRHVAEVHAGRGRGLAAGAVVHAVVQQHVQQPRRLLRADGGHGAQLHQRRAVPVQHHGPPPGRQRHAQAHAAGAAHGADLVQMLLPVRQGEQFPPALAGGGDHGGVRGQDGQQALQQRGPGGPRAMRLHVGALARRQRRAGRLVQSALPHAALVHDQGIGPARGHGGCGGVQSGGYVGIRLRERAVRNLDGVQQHPGDAAHQGVLRLVLVAGFAAPGDDQQSRDAEGMIERRQRVDGVAQPTVLHHHRRASPAQPGPGGDGDRLPLAGRTHVRRVAPAGDAVDERRQVAARHAGVEPCAADGSGIQEGVGLDHPPAFIQSCGRSPGPAACPRPANAR